MINPNQKYQTPLPLVMREGLGVGKTKKPLAIFF